MIKRFFFVALLTGFSQILSLVSVVFLKNLDSSLVYDIGRYESLVVVFTAIIALGLQLATTRDLAISNSWKNILLKGQRDRFTFSIIIFIVVLITDIILTDLKLEMFLFYSIIPLIALNADYSFYGKGEPVKGAFLSFLRVGILSMFIILSVIFNNPFVKITYIITVLIVYFLIGTLTSYYNKLSYLMKPKLDFYKSYIRSLDIGLASFSLVFFGLGVVSFAGYFYTEKAVANAYLLLKIYVFYIGIKRILVQVTFKELGDEFLFKKIDQIGSIIAVTVIIMLFYYPEYTLKYFIKNYQSTLHYNYYLLPAFLFTSVSVASSQNLLLKKKDKVYSFGFITGAIIILLLVFIFSFIDKNNESYIYLSISIGELIVILIHGWGLNKFNFFKSRLVFIIFIGILFSSLNYIFLLLEFKIMSLALLIMLASLTIIFAFLKINKQFSLR